MMAKGLQARGLRSAAELAADKPHGTRIRYVSGCKCTECRHANTAYESERQRARKSGDWNGIVDATPAREHLVALAKAGIGYKHVAKVAGISAGTAMAVRSGAKKQLRSRTARKILAVKTSDAAGGKLVPAGPTWARINALLAAGRTKTWIARELGAARPALQIRRTQIALRTERAVVALFNRAMPTRRAWTLHRFQKGQVPPNKGTRRPGWYAGRMREGWFKKGGVSPRWDQERFAIGALREASGDGYIEIKVADRGPRRWRPFHRFLWEAAHGPIPPGHVVRFKDGDKLNLELGNFELITLRENRLRNSIHALLPPEIKRAVMALGALKRAIRRKENADGKRAAR